MGEPFNILPLHYLYNIDRIIFNDHCAADPRTQRNQLEIKNLSSPQPTVTFKYVMKNSYEPLLENIPIIRDFVELQVRSSGFSKKRVMQICLAVEEIVTNIFYHGHLELQARIDVTCIQTEDSITILISDQGVPFNPLNSDNPNMSTTLMEREAGGLGLFFVKKFIDRIDYKRINNKNHVYLRQNK